MYGNHLGFLWLCDRNDKNLIPGLFVQSQLHLWQFTRQIALFLSTHNLFFVSHNLLRINKFHKKGLCASLNLSFCIPAFKLPATADWFPNTNDQTSLIDKQNRKQTILVEFYQLLSALYQWSTVKIELNRLWRLKKFIKPPAQP